MVEEGRSHSLSFFMLGCYNTAVSIALFCCFGYSMSAFGFTYLQQLHDSSAGKPGPKPRNNGGPDVCGC